MINKFDNNFEIYLPNNKKTRVSNAKAIVKNLNNIEIPELIMWGTGINSTVFLLIIVSYLNTAPAYPHCKYLPHSLKIISMLRTVVNISSRY